MEGEGGLTTTRRGRGGGDADERVVEGVGNRRESSVRCSEELANDVWEKERKEDGKVRKERATERTRLDSLPSGNASLPLPGTTGSTTLCFPLPYAAPIDCIL